MVVIDGTVGANGGAGGQGAGPRSSGAAGLGGEVAFAPVRGSATVSDNGGGGDGSDANGTAADGLPADYAGGGGGGGGRIRINSATGTEAFERLLPTMASGLATVGQIHIRR